MFDDCFNATRVTCHWFKEKEAAELYATAFSHLKAASLGEVIDFTTKGPWGVSITRLSNDYLPLSENWLRDPNPFVKCPLCNQLPKVWLSDNGAFANCECKDAIAISGEHHDHTDLRDNWNLSQRRKLHSKFGF